VTDWQGHRSATSEVLFELLVKARAGGEEFTRAERILVTACEFWSAARNRSLKDYLSKDAHAVLRVAEECFAVMDLSAVAAILRLRRIALANQDSPFQLEQVSVDIEEDLARVGSTVDEKIAQYACEQTWDHMRKRL